MLRRMAPSLPSGVLEDELEVLRGRARDLAARFGAPARRATTHGRERALLRLYGVEGLDREGRPLAATVVDRYLANHPERLAEGIGLPLGVAFVEYDVPVQQLALDIASGIVDLGLEAEVLAEPDRRASAEAALAALEAAAMARIDANRTARRELVAVLGDAPRPWIGVTLSESTAADAAGEARHHIRDGADLVRVDVPVGGELAARLGDAGREVQRWRIPPGLQVPRRATDAEIAPAGSQRGIGFLREALDRAAAERGAYALLATAPAALGAPESAAVAASERVDVLELDPLAEIIGVGIHPDRALADLAFAIRLMARSGGTVVLGTGPVVVGPDLAAGIPSDASTRAGRGLALQLLVASVAVGEGLGPEHLAIAALPGWIAGEPEGVARAAAEVALRSALLPEHPLAFAEPSGLDAPNRWPAIVAAVLPAGRTGLVIRRPALGGVALVAGAARAAADVARDLAASTGPADLGGLALEHARATVAAAIASLEGLDRDGWTSLLGEGPGAIPQLGADTVAERSERNLGQRIG